MRPNTTGFDFRTGSGHPKEMRKDVGVGRSRALAVRWAAGALLAGLSLFARTGAANTGVVDDGDQFPAVGAFYELTVQADGTLVWGEQSCTVTLVADDLAISAAHCTTYYLENEGVSGYRNEAWISFDRIASRNDFHCFLRDHGLAGHVAGPSDNGPADQLPCSRDGAGNPLENEPGIPQHPAPTFHRVLPSGWFDGTPISVGVSHPDYLRDHPHPDGTYRREVNNLANLPDLAVLMLETPVSSPAPMPLVAPGFLDTLTQVQQIPMVGVGYGLNWGKVPGTAPTGGSGPMQVVSGSGVRRIADIGTIQNVHQRSVVPSQRPNQGDDTVCYGDSGSPLFLDSNRNGQIEPAIAGILSGWTNWCQGSHDPYSRVDTLQASEFLDCVLDAPTLAAVRACGAEAEIDLIDQAP
jgi:hypothetical protein